MAKDQALKKMKNVPSLPELLINEDGSRIYHTIYKQDLKIHVRKHKGHDIKLIYIYSKKFYVCHLVYETFIGSRPTKIFYADGNRQNLHYENLLPKQMSDGEIMRQKLKQVPLYENLYINEDGTLIVQDNCILTIYKKITYKNRNFRVRIKKEGKAIDGYINQLVALAYYGEKPQDEPYYVIHLDNNHANNHYKNLKYVTGAELHEWQKKHNAFKLTGNDIRGFNHLTQIEITEILFLLKRGKTQKNIAEKYNVCEKVIWKVKNEYMSEEDRVVLDQRIITGDFYVEPEVKKLAITMIKSKKYTERQIAKMCDIRRETVRFIKNEFEKI